MNKSVLTAVVLTAILSLTLMCIATDNVNAEAPEGYYEILYVIDAPDNIEAVYVEIGQSVVIKSWEDLGYPIFGGSIDSWLIQGTSDFLQFGQSYTPASDITLTPHWVAPEEIKPDPETNDGLKVVMLTLGALIVVSAIGYARLKIRALLLLVAVATALFALSLAIIMGWWSL